MTRYSVAYRKKNAYIKSVQLNMDTWNMAERLTEKLGISFSKLVRELLTEKARQEGVDVTDLKVHIVKRTHYWKAEED